MVRAPKPLRGSRFKKTGRKAFPKRTYKESTAPLASRGFRFPINEKKFFDIAPATYQINTTGSITLLCVPVPGTDYTNRIGRKIGIKSVYIRGIVGLSAALTTITTGVTAQGQLLRLIIFVDMQPNGAAPALADLLNNATANAQLNPNNRDRFRVIKDKQWAFGRFQWDTTATQTYAMTSGNSVAQVKCFKRINLQTIFNAGTAGAIADINSGALYMCWVGDQAAGTDTAGAAVVSTRVRFYDA